jgi:hypothetical protein
VEEILGGDQVVAMAQVTPASGVTLTPLTNFGIRDVRAGTITPGSSSVGAWRKLRWLQERPNVAVAYHTRLHSLSQRPEYVLVQGRASLSALEDRGWLDRHREEWEQFAGPRDVGPMWERWLCLYHWRVAIEIEVKRVLVWPDLACRGNVQVYGAPLPSYMPPSQRTPLGGTEPRIKHARAARGAARLPHILLGWVGADGLPVVLPVEIARSEPAGILIDAPARWVPSGGRRAGLLAHTFARYTYGQHQRKHTGWLESDPAKAHLLYSPHTQHAYHLPASRVLYRLSAGLITRRRYRDGARAGFLPS